MFNTLCSVVVVGLAVSLYQAYRGFMFQWLRRDAPFKDWTKHRKVLLLALADGLFYLATTASGFIAFALCFELFVRITDPANIAGGTALLLTFLAVYGVLGVTGQLPYLIQQGKLLPPSLGGGP
jgi:hypothetical protein